MSRPALALVAVAFALFGVARTTGSGWLIVILTGIASVVVLAAVLPAVGLQRLTVAVEAPRDATVGRPSELVVTLGGGARPVKLRVRGFDGPWTGAVSPCRGALVAVPERRGVLDRVVVEVRSAAPLGLVWWRRRMPVALGRPCEVGPRPADVTETPPAGREDDGQEAARVISAMADAVRTIRQYVPGDAVKLVHWAATARAGEIMVKDLEAPVAPALVIAVDLRSGDDEAVEAAASRAVGLALAGLRAGVPVTLLTAERAGPRTGVAGSALEVGRRLARAVAGPLPSLDTGAARGSTPVVVSAGSTSATKG